MTKTSFEGVITALVTPFKNGALDLTSFKRVLRAQLEAGVNGFVINGTTGESPTLTHDEVKTLFDVARAEVGGQARLILGTGSNSTAKTIEFTETTSAWNPDAVLVVVPYYNRPPQRGLRQHFELVARASKAPVLLYNVPGRTVATLEPKTVGRLSQVENILGIKDATGDLGVLAQLRSEARSDFNLLSGDDGTCVDFAAAGGHGVIGVASHIIGAEMNAAITAARNGQAEAGSTYRAKFGRFINSLYVEPNPIPVKLALKLMGLIESAELRLPLVDLDSQYHGEVSACLKALGKI